MRKTIVPKIALRLLPVQRHSVHMQVQLKFCKLAWSVVRHLHQLHEMSRLLLDDKAEGIRR